MASKTTKVALVTGAARGVGRASALRLAEDGFDVAVNDVPGTPELDEVIKEIESKGRRTLCLPADISLEPDVERIVQEVVKEFGSLDVMVANTGILSFESVTKATVEGFDRLMAVNARGTMLCYKHAGKQMIAQGRSGRIIGACSQGGKQASPIAPAYCASKFAMPLTTRWLTGDAAQEFGQHGITVNACAPGAIDTRMRQLFLLFNIRASHLSNVNVPTILARSPIRRIGRPEEVAGLVSYLASDSAGFITGT
ncbi:hypothetical protein EI94DRAFT_1623656 [Lactarius quietus]|nr:hypothetical protein EI94DRAFT_1623656 [Lactarius quietus]